ncbi:class I SAM-dependent methyltransferase [Erwinia sorbitola]|uniref:Methyltransferase domain-containing protein n=1 Tax=Erwinia sorbitola TaxID=2681984 RepID=A0ABW9RCG4_9GAMM|nr:class I SAM-dependent methyltransferase [Erwinia sorbitola]MTD27254.1 methyltransferase domain-containing protein [Erwinia sorbitola]
MKPAKTRQIRHVPESWSQIPCGEFYRDALSHHLRPSLGKLYGFHLLKIGNLSAEIDTASCAISHQVSVGLGSASHHVKADPLSLPFESKSVDACLLAHTLAWSSDPHRVLREVDRVLIDDGWMIITGFNLFSVLGIGKLIPGVRRKVPWNSRMFTQMRLLDWLSLLNYEVMERTRFQVLPWNRQGGKIISTHLPALGCLSLIVARKRTFPLTRNPAKKSASQRQLHAVGATSQYREERKS